MAPMLTIIAKAFPVPSMQRNPTQRPDNWATGKMRALCPKLLPHLHGTLVYKLLVEASTDADSAGPAVDKVCLPDAVSSASRADAREANSQGITRSSTTAVQGCVSDCDVGLFLECHSGYHGGGFGKGTSPRPIEKHLSYISQGQLATINLGS